MDTAIRGSIDRVHLELVILDRDDGHDGAVVAAVEAAPGTRFGDVRRELAETAGCAGSSFWCGARAVADDDVLGMPPLLHGAQLATRQGGSAGLGAGFDAPRAVVVEVRSGPVSDDVRVLAPGRHVVGRDGAADVVVPDPEVSRRHALLSVAAEEAGTHVVHDLGSTNGTATGGVVVGAGGRPVQSGAELCLGATTLTLWPAAEIFGAEAASCRPDGSGFLLLNRPPRPSVDRPTAVVTWPDEPAARTRTRLNAVGMAVPLVGALLLAAVYRTPGFLAIAVLSPLFLVGSWLGDLMGGRRSARQARRDHEQALLAAQRQIAAAVSAEEAWWRSACPRPAALLASVTGRRADVWCRRPGRPDFLLLRLGTGGRPAAVTVTGRGAEPDTPALSDVPIAVDLADAGVVGIAGGRSSLLPLMRGLAAQVAGWHSPDDVTLAVLTARHEGDWEWVRWLPHVAATARHPDDPSRTHAVIADLVRLLDRRTTARPAPDHALEAPVVVVMDGAQSLRGMPGVSRLLAEGPAVGLFSICCDQELVTLPAECAVTVRLGPAPGSLAEQVQRDGSSAALRPEGVSAGWAHRFASALAPLRDWHDGDGIDAGPATPRLADLCAAAGDDAGLVVEGWRRRPAGTGVALGIGRDGRLVRVDLAADGPHALVAGTTGSGKSELLQTLVCALAVTNRPDRLSFVLLDYKGGAAFREAARLPHTVGLVTDLDSRLGARALLSMQAEVRRRERVLRDAGCVDFAAYELVAARPMPRLVLVVDEFAALVEELPDFVGGLVALAQRGRSLGIHLVLATQRPAGVVSADIKANTNLRIALRVLDPADSVDVVDCRDAAGIAADRPGRAVLRVGNDPVVHLQVARVTGPPPTGRSGTRVRLVARCGQAGLPLAEGSVAPEVVDHGPAVTPTDQSLLVEAVRTAAQTLGLGPSPAPWVPPLPAQLAVGDLPAAPPGSVAVGLVDVPEEQGRAPMVLGLESGGHLLVVGGPRSGRTTLLRLAALQLATTHPPDDLHVHVVDAGRGLSDLTALPHCGTVAGRDDPALTARLLELLVAELQRRQRHRPDAGWASSGATDPWVLLLVDDWDAVVDAFDDVDRDRVAGLLDRLVREGGSVGFRVVVTGGRRALTSRLASSVPDRVVLRLADPTDYALAGVAGRDVPRVMPPGRGLLLPAGHEVQLARPGPGLGPDVAGLGSDDGAGPVRLRPLPDRASLAEALVEGKEVADGPAWTLVGLGGDAAGVVGVDLASAGPAMLVSGPPGSGRSTALSVMARWLLQQGRRVAVVTHPASPLHRLGGCVQVAADADELLGEVCARGDLTVLVDDVEALADTAVERALQELVRPGARAAVSLVVSGTTSELAATYRGLAVDVRRSRTGLLLGPPGPADGDLLGTRLPRMMTGAGPPGRGVLVVRGRPLLVQVPAVDG